jgi:hypothetical protein
MYIIIQGKHETGKPNSYLAYHNNEKTPFNSGKAIEKVTNQPILAMFWDNGIMAYACVRNDRDFNNRMQAVIDNAIANKLVINS